MAADLLGNYREKTAKIKDKGLNTEAEFDVQYSSGFLALDCLNGTVVHVESKDRNFQYNSIGIVDGSANSFIGRTGCGKSTLTVQIAGNIARPFIKKGMPTSIHIDDIEKGLPFARKCFLLGLSNEEVQKYVKIRTTGITTDNVLQAIKALRDIKIQNRKDYEYDTGLYDTYGKRIFKYVPSIYMIDSLPMLLPKDLADEEELGGSMSASSIAKSNTMFAKQVVQWCSEANIILFTINHIMDDIQMGFIPKAAQISGLKQGERLPGGKVALYLANNMFRVDDSITLKADKDFGIDGSKITITLLKSRTNATKQTVPLIFNKTEGRYDKELSLLQLMLDYDKVDGIGTSCYIRGYNDLKFGKKTFKQCLEQSPQLQEAVARTCYDILIPLLSETKNYNEASESVMDNITSLFNSFGQTA